MLSAELEHLPSEIQHWGDKEMAEGTKGKGLMSKGQALQGRTVRARHEEEENRKFPRRVRKKRENLENREEKRWKRANKRRKKSQPERRNKPSV